MTRLTLAAIVVLAFALRFLHWRSLVQTEYPQLAHALIYFDMRGFLDWSDRIIGGDILGRDTFHPYHDWMRRAPIEQWYQWWGGKGIFQQEPFYPYLLALLRGVFHASIPDILLLQLMVGSLQPLVVYGLANRLFDRRVGVVAALATAVYGPFIFYQGTLLRDWLPPLVEPLALLLVLRAHGSQRLPPWIVAGVAFGLAVLIKSVVLGFVFVLMVWVLRTPRGNPSPRLAAAALLAGILLGLCPLVTRNVIVGAPPFAISNRAAEAIIEGNAADGYPVGMKVPPSMFSILDKSDGRLAAVVVETWRTYEGRWEAWLWNQILKVRGNFEPFDVPNNASLTYAQGISPVLRFTLGFGVVAALGLAGLLLGGLRWNSEQTLAAAYLLTTVLALTIGNVLGRYRLVLVPLLIIYAARAGLTLTDRLRGPSRGAVAAIAVTALCLLVEFVVVPIPAVRQNPESAVHAVEYKAAVILYVADGRYLEAIQEARRLAGWSATFPTLENEAREAAAFTYLSWASDLLRSGQAAAARTAGAHAVEALAPLPASELLVDLASLYSRLDDDAAARRYLDRYLASSPSGARAGQARDMLARLE